MKILLICSLLTNLLLVGFYYIRQTSSIVEESTPFPEDRSEVKAGKLIKHNYGDITPESLKQEISSSSCKESKVLVDTLMFLARDLKKSVQNELRNHVKAGDVYSAIKKINDEFNRVEYAEDNSLDIKELDEITKAKKAVNAFEMEEAENILKTALEQNPDNSLLLKELSSVYLYQYKSDEAKDILKQLLLKNPDNTEYLALFAHVYTVSGKTEEGLQFLHSIQDAEGNYPFKNWTIALTYSSQL